MKRFKKIFVLTLVLFLSFITKVNASGVVEVYLFRGEGCPHCAEAEEFFDELENNYLYSSKFNLTDYEVWYDDDNKELMEKVAEKLNTTVTGVPFIVIGENYYKGYSADIGEKIKSTIYTEYYNSNYKDIVESIENYDYYYNDIDDYDYNDLDDYDYNYNYNYFGDYLDSYERDIDRGIGAIFGTFFFSILIFIIIFSSIIAIYNAFILWKVFKKAGRNGWEAIIPFYSRWVLYEISGYPGAYIFFAFIPFVGTIISFVFQIIAAISLAKKFKKDGGFHVLLWLLPVIGYSILAFGDATYDGSLGEQRNSTKSNNTNNNSSNESYEQKSTVSTKESKFCGNCGCRLTKDSKHCTNCGKKVN